MRVIKPANLGNGCQKIYKFKQPIDMRQFGKPIATNNAIYVKTNTIYHENPPFLPLLNDFAFSEISALRNLTR